MAATPSPEDYEHVFRFVRRQVWPLHEAEDITQQVFADFAETLARSSTSSPPSLAWLYTVAQRRIVDELRRRSRRPTLEPFNEDDEALTRAYGEPVASAITRALGHLSTAHREIVVGRLVQGRNFRDLARSASISEEACRMRFMRGLQQLREELTREGVTP